MRSLHRIRHFIRAFGQAKRHRTDLIRQLGRRPLLAGATVGVESAMLLSNKVDPKLKELAELKAAGMVSCEFCLDIGSALAASSGVTEQQMRDLPRYQNSTAYSDLEKLVIAYAEAMTLTPAVGDDLADLRRRLGAHLTETQIVELAMTVAWENQRARLNQSLGVRPTGMSDGMACALPERVS
ncbi:MULTISPECIES: carboxymuconolactone decarboxylase family protein [Gordonia]|uniref:Alkylhydroperoxidase n=1 Tax=Gordonia alkanivorans CGMCC 6845 TaxID=1423140 RepID=W9DF45_9ACTN|nr:MULTISPECIES: carboxymuconolactone decarboxylase family protein [Gordonia]ETA07082.1 alkylhydroperoxidase [Gordonia alkanivorans CGMCC 6845]MDH3008942.1 carboxymuconolactone decarboxylase family protein [Gordonia alkanivorans]MDH3012461.1 carboxymuconolactone decarboxylase family protein [Gordonia alkanivorans]MDH3017903.1 carboxymuconolactone decarboxylase family protein [Gordonia alkanivorans]MDH3043273.1 carboxymuconolactone decarboxylase family protein [Gordonia alkanivorans]